MGCGVRLLVYINACSTKQIRRRGPMSTSEAARQLSKKGASKGGKARAATMLPKERSAAASRAAKARWAKEGKASDALEEEALLETFIGKDTVGPLFATFSGTLLMGDIEIHCHVLNDGRRVMTQREITRALTGGRRSGSYLQNIPNFDLASMAPRIIQFKDPKAAANNFGYEATMLIEICEAYLGARDAGLLKPRQMHMANAAEVIVRASARVGILALVDEATGYQEVRARNALQAKLQLFIAEEMGDWSKHFPDEFWTELARLEGIRYSGRNRPLRWGKYVMKFVYDAIDPDVSKQLAASNPNPSKGKNHHQLLTAFGQKELDNHLQQVIAVMRLCNDMDDFKRKFPRAFPRVGGQLEISGYEWDYV